MALSPPAAREAMHHRKYDFTGYRREDGLWDIEGRMTDAKTYSFPNDYRGTIEAGEALHDMWIRLTVDESLRVQDIEAVTDGSPYAVCPAITPNFKRMIGTRVGAGWRAAIRDKLGGAEGCTHLVEMLGAMGTVTFQTLYPVLAKKAKGVPRRGMPPLLNSCHAYSSDGEIAKRLWPEFYTGS